MKHLLLTFFYLLLFSNCIIAQYNSPFVSQIDSEIILLQRSMRIQPNLLIDSSQKGLEPFSVAFFSNVKNNKIAKAEYILIKPDVKISYYYSGDQLIKVIAVDNSTSQIFNIAIYFNNGKLIYNTHRSIDGDNSGKVYLQNAQEYLQHFYNLKQ